MKDEYQLTWQKTWKGIQIERVKGERQMCIRTSCPPGTERFMCLGAYEAMANVKTLEIERRQDIKGFLFPVKQLELYFEGLRESLMGLFYLFHHDYKINLCLF